MTEGSLASALASADVFVDGDWVESKDQDPDGDVRLVQLADVGDGEYIDRSSRFMTMDKARALRCTFLRPGDVLVARMPDPLGRACIFPGDPKPAVTVVDVCIIRPDCHQLDPRWLMHSLNSPACRNQIAGYATGTTRARISRSNLGKIRVTVPPLPEQRRIAAILDQADALRAKRRAAIAQLDTLAQSIFLDMFGDPVANPKGWPSLRIDEVCELIVDCVNRTAPTVDEVTPFKMIRTSNVRNGDVDLTNVRYVSEPTFLRWNRRATPRSGDVILTREAPVGEVGILKTTEPVFLGQRLMLYRPDPARMVPAYLAASLQGQYVQRQFEQYGSGTTVKHLPLPVCRSFETLCPPVRLQKRFACQVAKLEQIREMQQRALSLLDTLFASLQHSAFRGEL